MAFPIKQDAGDPDPFLFDAPDGTIKEVLTPGTGMLRIDDLDAQDAADPGGTAAWLQADYIEGTIFIDRGWVRRVNVDLGTTAQPEFNEMTEDSTRVFIQDCAETERATRESNAIEGGGAQGVHVILADYLIALALSESGLEKMGCQRPGTDAAGPFQLTSGEWAEFLASDAGADYRPLQRFQLLAQIAAATFLTQRDWRALVAIAADRLAAEGVAEDDRYVPSFLNLWHARMIGPEAAFAVNAANADDDRKNDDLDALLLTVMDAEALKALKTARGRFLTATPPLSVNGFFNKTSQQLRGWLTNAVSLLKKYYPDFLAAPLPMQAPWMATAAQEMAFWSSPDVTETSPLGSARILNDYFKATNHHPDQVEPWCGAFVAWCLANCGDPAAAASVFPGAARAANWQSWGSTAVRPGEIKSLGVKQLEGAVVVLHPDKDTGSSGHVCFAVSRSEDILECIGGNQSDTVRKSSYNLSRVAALRLLQPQETASLDGSEIAPPTVALIKDFEGLELEAYQDAVGVWTIGYGTTTAAGIGVTVGPGMTITEAQAEAFLLRALEKFAAEIKPAITRAFSSNQFGAMLSLAYNIGTPRFKSSTCLKRFNAGDLAGAAQALTWWNKADGQVLDGLVSRRAQERDYFLNG